MNAYNMMLIIIIHGLKTLYYAKPMLIKYIYVCVCEFFCECTILILFTFWEKQQMTTNEVETAVQRALVEVEWKLRNRPKVNEDVRRGTPDVSR